MPSLAWCHLYSWCTNLTIFKIDCFTKWDRDRSTELESIFTIVSIKFFRGKNISIKEKRFMFIRSNFYFQSAFYHTVQTFWHWLMEHNKVYLMTSPPSFRVPLSNKKFCWEKMGISVDIADISFPTWMRERLISPQMQIRNYHQYIWFVTELEIQLCFCSWR